MGIRRWWADYKAAFNVAAEKRRRRKLRDQFAGQAMAGLMVNGGPSPELIASLAYEMADLMLEAREE